MLVHNLLPKLNPFLNSNKAMKKLLGKDRSIEYARNKALTKKLEDDDLKGYADKIGLNVPQFEKDMKSDKLAQLVKADIAEGRRIKVSGTPTLFINGKRVQNRSLEAMKKVIEDSLKK